LCLVHIRAYDKNVWNLEFAASGRNIREEIAISALCVSYSPIRTWNKLPNADNSQADFDQLYSELLGLIDWFYRIITITSSDPPYVTPSEKSLLRRKNTLMQAGRIDEANSLARRNGKSIIRKNTAELRNVDTVT